MFYPDIDRVLINFVLLLYKILWNHCSINYTKKSSYAKVESGVLVFKLTSKVVFLIMETENSAENAPSQCFEIGATVISGLEPFAKEECEEKLKCKAVIDRGRIYFHIAQDQLHSVSCRT